MELIDRQAALSMRFSEGYDKDGVMFVPLKEVTDGIKALPLIYPKRGRWEFRTVFPNDTSEFPMGYLICSECGSKHPNKTPCNFCDNCGADMRGNENGRND